MLRWVHWVPELRCLDSTAVRDEQRDNGGQR